MKMKLLLCTAFICATSSLYLRAHDKTAESQEQKIESPKKYNISPHIPMGGVKQLTAKQFQDNVSALATINDALSELSKLKDKATAQEKEHETLLKERQAYLSFIVNSYKSYQELVTKS